MIKASNFHHNLIENTVHQKPELSLHGNARELFYTLQQAYGGGGIFLLIYFHPPLHHTM